MLRPKALSTRYAQQRLARTRCLGSTASAPPCTRRAQCPSPPDSKRPSACLKSPSCSVLECERTVLTRGQLTAACLGMERRFPPPNAPTSCRFRSALAPRGAKARSSLLSGPPQRPTERPQSQDANGSSTRASAGVCFKAPDRDVRRVFASASVTRRRRAARAVTRPISRTGVGLVSGRS